MRLTMMPPPRLKSVASLCDLAFDLLTLKADHFMPLPHQPVVSVCIEVFSAVF